MSQINRFDDYELDEILPLLRKRVEKFNSLISSGEASPDDVSGELFILPEDLCTIECEK